MNIEDKKSVSNRRLTNKQFKSLMDKAKNVLGINNLKGLPILDINCFSDKPKLLKDSLREVLTTLEYSSPKLLKSYNNLIKNKKINYKEKISILGWLINGGKKPIKLIDPKERCNVPRNSVLGLKKWGNIKTRQIREVFDQEFLKEIGSVYKNNKKLSRKKFDGFDKLDLDTKIIWARYAKEIIGDTSVLNKTNYDTPNQDAPYFYMDKERLALLSMKYACKMCNIDDFTGIFAKSYWIIHRINSYIDLRTERESNTLVEISMEFLEKSQKPSLKILGYKELLAKIEPIILEIGKQDEYEKWINKNTNKTDKDKFRKASEIIRRNYF